VANAQARFAQDGSALVLSQALGDLLSLGPPQSMSELALGGYAFFLTDLYTAIDQNPPPDSFLHATPVDTGSAAYKAFDAYLLEFCPP
jgi:hypothetical protein